MRRSSLWVVVMVSLAASATKAVAQTRAVGSLKVEVTPAERDAKIRALRAELEAKLRTVAE